MFEMKYNSDYMHYLTLEAPREALNHSGAHVNIGSWFHAIIVYVGEFLTWYWSLFYTANLFWITLAVIISFFLFALGAVALSLLIIWVPMILFGAKLFSNSQHADDLNIYQYIGCFFKNIKYKTGSYIGCIGVSPNYLPKLSDFAIFTFFNPRNTVNKIISWFLLMTIVVPITLLGLVFISAVPVALIIMGLDLLGYIPFSTLTQLGVILTCAGSLYVFIKKEPKWYPLIILACVVYSITLLIYEPDFYFSTFSKARYYFHPEQAKEAVNIWAYVMVFIFYLSSLELLRIFISMTYFSWARKRFMRKHPDLYTGVENNEVKNNAPDLPITTGELSTNAT